ncbi:MAG: DEAD/DEAH box helicase, partial [Oscillospiraceae bacterium]|nr:DEAD/DEAH box helicase [Oscillospiraceae bacterium]
LKIDMEGVRTSQGDYKAADVGSALEPYLEQIADEMRTYCAGRKTVVFLPLIETSKKFCAMLTERGFRAAEVNGGSDDRAETLSAFERGDYDILCNSMLLTEGWDCPSVDCVVVLRPTKVRSLYTQMIGRGTRLHPGKDHLLILDFLWHTERHELCRPACLICDKPEIAEKMTENLEDGEAVDLVEAEEKAESDALADREAALAKMLEEQRHRKRALVDPLQFEMSIAAEDIAFYTPSMGWEIAPPTKKQIALLEKRGIFPDEIDNAGKAQLIIDRLMKRQADGLTTPKQIRFLEGRGFKNVGLWQFAAASSMIGRISSNGWRIPHGISPETYKPDDKEIEDREWLRSI